MTSYSLESCCPISWKIGWSSAGVAVSTYLPPVRFARLLSVAGSYCGELRPTEMTRTFASVAAWRASARDASLPTSVPSERRTTVVRSSPWSLALFTALTSAS